MLRLKYDRIVAYHGYEQSKPSDIPGARLLIHLDGVNGSSEMCKATGTVIQALEAELLRDASAAFRARYDNKYGYTVAIDGASGEPATFLQVRFHDNSLYVWQVPEPR